MTQVQEYAWTNEKTDGRTDQGPQNSAPFTDCITDTDNEMDQVGPVNIIMPIYNLIEYSINYSKSSGSSWQCYKDKPTNPNVDTIDANSGSFKLKSRFTENADVDDDNGKVQDKKV